MAYLIEGRRPALIVAALLAAALAAHFPTSTRMDDWIARQRERELRANQFGARRRAAGRAMLAVTPVTRSR